MLWIVCERHPRLAHRHPIAYEAAVMQMTPDRLLELVCRIEGVIAEQVEASAGAMTA